MMTIKREVRFAELRALDQVDEGAMMVEGRALVYDSPTNLYEYDGLNTTK